MNATSSIHTVVYKMKNNGLQVNPELLTSTMGVYKDFMNTARTLLGNESKDLGGDFYNGGFEIDDYLLRRYTRMLLDDDYAILKGSDGAIYRDTAHLILAKESMRKHGRSEEDLDRVLALSYIASSNYILQSITTVKKVTARTNRIAPPIKPSITYYDCSKYPFIFDRYMISICTPQGYTSYVYEPTYIASFVFLTKVCGMTAEFANEYIKQNTDKGLLLTSVPLEVENKFAKTIFGGGILKLDGFFKKNYHSKASSVLENSNVFMECIKPYMLGAMGALVQKVYEDMAKLPDILDTDCYINQLTPSRISVCLRSDLSINEVLPSVANKFSPVDISQFSYLNYANGGEY